MANSPRDADIERAALAIFERIAERGGDARLRDRLLRGRSPDLVARIEALERSDRASEAALSTRLHDAPGGERISAPDRIGPFRLVERIGEGGMGEVWRARRDDGLYEQTVAIKLLHAHLAGLAGSRFAEERRLLARLDHPAIARLIDGGVTADGVPYLVMEHFDGAPIDLAVAPIALRQRIRLFAKVAEAVQFAHGRLVVHADLKPSNILVADDGRVKLLDFGIGRLVGEDDATGLHPLTPAYASPARLAGAAPTIADDVYALGLMLAPLADGDPDLHAVAAMATAPEQARYGSVAALVADLDRWRDRLPVSARRPSLRYRAGRFVDRHRIGVAATALAMLLLIAASALAIVGAVRATRAQGEAERRFEEVRGLANYQLFALYDRLAVLPGTVGVRAAIAARSAAYLDGLGATADAPPTILLETAAGYRRLAAIEGLSGTSSLGRPDRAAQALDRAERLARRVLTTRPRDAGALDLLGWIYADRWTLLANNAASPRMNRVAAGWFARALAIDPQLSHARLGRLVTMKSAAYDLIVADKMREARPILTVALRTLHRERFATADREAALQLESTLLNTMGDAAYDGGDVAGSLGWYRAQVRLVDGAIAGYGATPDWLTRKGEALFDLSGSLADVPGGNDEALAAADVGIAAVERVLALGADANAEKKLVMLLGQKAVVLGQLDRFDEAVAASARSLAIRRARLAAAPADPARIRDVAIAATRHAALLEQDKRRPEACAAATLSISLWSRLADRHQIGLRDTRRNVPEARALAARTCGSRA